MTRDTQQSRTAPALRTGQLLGLLCVTCATLLLQISWTRVLSVSLWYHFAFLVVSTAMLGFGLSGALLATSHRLANLELSRALPLFAAGQAISTVLGFWIANLIPLAPFSLLVERQQLLYLPAYLICIATPFVFSGLAAAMLLGRLPQHAGRIYGFDLAGAGLGCGLIILLMPAGGSTAVVGSGAIAAVGAILFCEHRRARGATALLVASLALLSWRAESLLPIRISKTKIIGAQRMDRVLRSPARLYTRWNTFSRVDVLPHGPHMRQIVIDAGTAMTRLPRVTTPPIMQGPIDDIRRLVLDPQLEQTVLVIGSGGGWEVLAALRTRAKRVVAVEVNPLINEIVRFDMAAYVGRIFQDPRVELHTAEARSFVRSIPQHYDVIIAQHTISNAATASGAMSLAETYILTVEAFEDYLAHLTDRGMLWFTRPEPQLPRLVATVRAALERAGSPAPAEHVIAFAEGPAPSFSAGVLVSRYPLSKLVAVAALSELSRHRVRALYVPGQNVGPPIYRDLLQANPTQLDQLFSNSHTLLHPATDDSPFFNQRSRWRDVDRRAVASVFSQRERGRMALEDQPVTEVTLLMVLAQSITLALLFVLLPLWLRRRDGLGQSKALLLYFLLLGLGFILTEIALIQRLTLFVGQPVFAFATVVGSLLLFSAAGSWYSQRVGRDEAWTLPRRLSLLLGLVALALVIFALASGPLLRALLGLPLAGRLAVTAALLAPIGALMGTAFPLGLRYAGQRVPLLIPWAWGLNAVASVVGSVLAIVLATVIGFSGVLLVAAATYATSSLIWLRR